MQADFDGHQKADSGRGGSDHREPTGPDISAWSTSNLTRSQQLIWLAMQLNPGTPLYNMIHASTIYGALDPAHFCAAFQAVVDASDALRTTVETVDGVPRQQVADAMPAQLDIVDLSRAADPDNTFRNWIESRKLESFDPGTRLFSSALVKLGDERYVWYLNQNHLIADAASFELILDAVANCYKLSAQNSLTSAPDLPQFSDYVQHERQFIESPAALKARDYWSNLVAKDLPPVNLYNPQTERKDARVRRFAVDLGASRSEALRTLAASKGFASLSPALTMSSLWSTIVGVMLHRLTGESLLRIGTPFQARPSDKFKQTIGNFVEVGVLNVEIDADATFTSLFQQILRNSIKSLRFVQPGISNAEMNRSYSVRLNYVTATFEQFIGHRVSTEWIHPGFGDDAHGLQIQVCDFDATGQYVLYFDVPDDTFDADCERRVEQHLKAVVDSLLAEPGRSTGSFDLLSPADRLRLIDDYNNTDRSLADATSVVALFEDQARRSPAAVALTEGRTETSYEELALRVSRVCQSLQAYGARRGDRIAICMHRNSDVVAAMLAVMKSGAAFCPIDPAYPETRKLELLEDLEPLAVIVDDSDSSQAIPRGDYRVFTPDSLDVEPDDSVHQPPDVEPDDVAYLIYTSGSTGRPKAAMLSHAGISNYIAWAADTYARGEALDFALYSSLAFDLTLTSIFAPLITGGRIRLYDEDDAASALEVLEVFGDDAVDVVKLTPSHLELVLQRELGWKRISKLIVGGEEFSTSLARRLLEKHSSVEVYNEYGPTEATIGCMVHRFDPATDSYAAVPIGSPAANMRIYVRDQYGQPTPEGVAGEMVIGGPGVALGYWNRPELTREKFAVDADTGERLYRSGDLAQWESWGLLFLGRSDDQVKVRGVRVELGELENRLTEHPEVDSAAAVLSMTGGDNLAAYYVSRAQLGAAKLKAYLEAALPEHLVPTYLVRLDEIPLTHNGKVDRKALPDPQSHSDELRANFVAASSPLEKQLVALWQQVTGIGRIGIDDNFFELGGDSVMCIQIAAKAQDLGIDIAPRSLFLKPTVRELASHAAATVTDTEPAAQVVWDDANVERVRSTVGEEAYAELEDIYPLTPTQTGMLYHCLSTRHRSVYVGQVSGTIEGSVDLDKLRIAYQQLVDAHPALRTRFFWQGLDDPLQAVCRDSEADWHELDWSTKRRPEFDQDFELLKQSIRDTGFDLAGDPPLNLTVVRASDSETHIVWTTHHILFDGWSAYPLFNEWLQRYDALCGNDFSIPAPRPFRDYVAWLQQQDEQERRDFWSGQLGGLEGPTLLPIGKRAASSENREKHELILDEKTTASLEQVARHKQVTLNALFEAAWAILLGRYCDSDDVVFGVTHSGRNADLAGVDRMIGLFINTLPARFHIDATCGVQDWLPEVQQTLLAISEFEASSLAEAQQIAGQTSDQLLFDSIVVFENYPSVLSHDASGITLGELSFTAPSHYPLAVLVYPEDSMKIHFIFDDARFSECEMARLGGHLGTLLGAIAADPDCLIGDLDLLQAEELSRISEWTPPTQVPIPAVPLHMLIDSAAARQPDSIAVSCGDEQLSYSALIAAADSVASSLLDAGIGKDSLVGVVARRTPRTVAGILGILKSGAAFVPLDPANPESRTREIVTEAGIEVVLSDGDPALPDLRAQIYDVRQLTHRQSDAHPGAQAADMDALAYVLFTSGTTGKPKGVMVTQHNIVHSTVARQHYYPEPVRAFLHLSSFAFDSAMAGLFWTLCDGGTLVLPEADSERDVVHLLELLSRHGVSHLLALPSFYRAMLEAAREKQLDQLAAAIVAGEACPLDLHALHRSRCPEATLYNEYGPTEATVWSHVYQFPEAFDGDTVSIGIPIANVSQQVLDSRQRQTPVGVPGELVLGGDGIARGYLGRDELTEAKFVHLPERLASSTSRFYRTGDRVAWRDDGSLDFLGRIDEQIKIRGYRVEPAEIEASLLEHPDIVGAAAGMAEQQGLTAWYEAAAPIPADQLQSLASAGLPAFMQPSHYVHVEEMPTLANGKVDRRRLAAQHPPTRATERSYYAPETILEQDLSEVWAELLTVERVGTQDNFFDLGGDSISALRVAAHMHRRGWNVQLRDIVATTNLHELANRVDQAGHRRNPIVSVPRRQDRQRFPLSAAQQRLWFLEQMEDVGSINNVYGIYRFRGDVSDERLAWVFSQLMERHEILRTTIVEDGDQLWQQVSPETEPNWALEDLQDEQQVTQRIDELLDHNFDLSAGPPWFVRLLRREHQCTLVMVFHHVIIDGESIPVLLDDISQFYTNGAVYDQNKGKVLQYGDFAAWQSEHLTSGAAKEALEYWTGELAGDLPTLDFPAFRPRPTAQSFRGKVVSSRLSDVTAQRIRQYAETHGLSLNNVLLSAFSAVLMRFCRQDELIVGSPIGSQRHRVGAESGLGPYINTVAIRMRPERDWSFETLCRHVSDKSTDALEFGDLPFERVVDALDLPRDLSRTPVYQAFFAFRQSASDRWHLPDVEVQQLRRPRNLSRTDISCWVNSDSDINFDLEFATDLFDADLAERFLNCLMRYLDSVQVSPQQRWSSVPLQPAADEASLLRRRGPTETANLDRSIGDLVWSAAEQFPENIAVTSGDVTLTYEDLKTKALAIAAALQDQGVQPGDIVGLALGRNHGLPMAILGVLEAGAAYVPLDMDLPADRLRHVVSSAGLRLVVTDHGGNAEIPGFAGPVLSIDELASFEVKAMPASFDAAEALAYIMYTSGSTGLPKGVAVGHHQLVNFLTAMQEPLAMTSRDVLAAITTTSFDISILELLLPLCCGARVHIVPAAATVDGGLLASELRSSGATLMQGTPASWRLLLDSGWSGDGQLRALCGGERLPLDLARALKRHCSRVWNLYGPTETTIWSTQTEIPDDPQAISIGRPIQNTRIYIIDEDHALVPDGVKGQIAIAGDGVAHGYHRNDDLTRDAFVADPFFPDQAMYLTGDLGRWRPDGQLEHLGRLDSQLKIRGFRIEAGDIENNLVSAPGIAAAAVTTRPGPNDDPRLVAFVVAEHDATIAVPKLRAHLQDRVPAYMVPQHFVELQQLPLTPNRKVDYQRLPAIEQADESARSIVAPRTSEERGVASIWTEMLGLERFSISANFFELGGHSLLAARLASRLSTEFGRRVSIAEVFQNPTVEKQALLAVDQGPDNQAPLAIAEDRDEFPLTSIQQRLWFLEQLEGATGVQNIVEAWRLQGDLDISRLRLAFAQLAEREEILRTLFVSVEGVPRQKVLPEPKLDFRFDSVDDEQSLREQLQDSAAFKFDLGARPPWFVHVIRFRDDYVLLLNFHHVLLDAESVRIVLEDVSAFYETAQVGPATMESRPQYGDFALWQQDQDSTAEYNKGLDFWRSEMAGELPTLGFPSFVTRPPEQTFAGDQVEVTIDPDIADRLRQSARRCGSTLFNVLLSAYAGVMSRYCRQQEIIVGTPVGTVRDELNAGRSIGPYINTVALRLKPDQSLSFEQLIGSVSAKTQRAIEFGNIPFEDVVRTLSLPRDLSRTPVFQTLFALRDSNEGTLRLPGIASQREPVTLTAARTDITCWVVDDADGIHFELEYARDLFDRSVVENFALDMRRTLEGAIEGLDRAWSAIPLQAPDTALARGPSKDVGGTIPEQVRAIADSVPDDIAISATGSEVSYGELRQRTQRIAVRLREEGLVAGEVIGLAVSRSERLPLAILGILEAGGAYLPLDLDLPPERLRHVLQDSGVESVLTDASITGSLPDFDGRLLTLDEVDDGGAADDGPVSEGSENDLAYLIYTSGSTGLPKGVEIGHRQVVNMLASFAELTGIRPGDALAAITTTTFDISVLELLLPLTTGGRVHVVSESVAADGRKLAHEIGQCGASLMQATPATWRLLLDAGWPGDPTLRVLCGGEALPLSLAGDLRERCHTLWNVYGPTETTVWSTIAEVPDTPTSIDVGRPIHNTTVMVVDESLRQVPVGVEGEIVIGGDGLALGYHNKPDLTAEKFVASPGNEDQQLYRTGDRGRWLPDGKLEHLGRFDTQLKVRGYRIEAGDVEHNLASAPGVSKVAVAKRAGPQGDERLVAFVVPEPGRDVDAMTLRRHLRDRLPTYMIPQHFLTIEELPLTPNLKVDYLRLPQLDGQHHGKAERRHPDTASEKYVADLWAELLGVDDISATDNFIELGGHSLLTIRVIARIAAETGIELGPQDLLSRTLAGVAALLDANGGLGKSTDPQEPVSRTSGLLALLGIGRRRP